jgi:hypothetical protein
LRPASDVISVCGRVRWCTFMPLKNTSLAVVVGPPLEVPRIQNPSQEVVDEYLDRYITAVTGLFHRHKHKYANSPDERLVIT